MTSGPNWARRYGHYSRRLCARPGCGAPAAATLRFQPTQREAWLVDLDDDSARTEGDLCARHAAGLVLPRGWQLHNGLTATLDTSSSPPFPAPPAAPTRRSRGASVARARRRRTATSAVQLPGLTAVNDVRAGEGAGAQPAVETIADPPIAGSVDAAPAPLVAAATTAEASVELAETLDAQTPLLRRAFSNVWLPDGPAGDLA